MEMKKELTAHEKIARKNIHHAINWIVGGLYNILQDYDDEEAKRYLPKSREDLEEEIYASALNNLYGPGFARFGKAPREMRFAGEDFCRETIKKLLDKDGDTMEIAAVMKW